VPYAIALHGGAGGAVSDGTLAALGDALDAGYAILRRGGGSLQAVIAAVAAMEDAGCFNAGRGSVANADRRFELDAAVMEGKHQRAGAVAGVSRIRNPVLAAEAVMRHTKHLMLVAGGAEKFARLQRLRMVPPSYFTESTKSKGTVGAVALDRDGNLAAATSTGGITGKLAGRVGDSPIVGAGTYADNRACAVSATGDGEMFLRAVLAHDIAARMRYRKEPLARAAAAALRSVAALGGRGGLVAIDRRGNIAMPFNARIMYRACVDARGRRTIAVW